MRAIVITESGGPDVLQLREAEPPMPASDQMLVRVHATAVNRADLMQRRGQYPAPAGAPADIPGLEYAGVVEQVGASVRAWKAGQRVMGIVGGGSYAEYVVVHEGEALPIPERLTFEQAAAVPEAFLTADDALFTLMRLSQGESVLVHAAASGVGTAAVQLAHAAGARVIGTSRSADKLERLRDYGMDLGIDARTDDFAAVVQRYTDGRGVDGVADLVGGSYLSGNIACLGSRGRLIVIGLTAGATAELDLRAVLRKRLHIIGTVMRARNLEEKIQVAARFKARSWPWLDSGIISPVIDRVLPISSASEAHRVVESNATFGKVVLVFD